MKKIIWIVLTALCIVTILFSGYQLYGIFHTYREGEQAYAKLEDSVHTESTAVSSSAVEFPKVDFAALQEINPDIVGWLYGCDGEINYPVVQGRDNQYYLNHLFDGTVNKMGCLFLDAEVSPDFSDFHSIVYGHYIKNDTMFAALRQYKEPVYFAQHPIMLLVTPEQNYVIELFSGYISAVDDEAWQLLFASDNERETWLTQTCAKSTADLGIIPSANDRIVTLSTCSYEFKNARFVVHGRLKTEAEYQ